MNSRMKVVTNSTPLIELSKINRLELLREVYGSIIIPTEVYTEVVIDGVGKPGAAEVKAAEWIFCQAVIDGNQVKRLRSLTHLDLGECGAIALAEEIDAQRVIIDDCAAREIAIARGLPVVGTVGVLIVAKARHLIPAVKPILDTLRSHGARISDKLYRQALTTTGE